MSDNVIDVKDGEDPFYTKEETATPIIPAKSVDQGPGSGLDSNTVMGIQAVTAAKAAPNVLVATDANSKLPTSTIPFYFATWTSNSDNNTSATVNLSTNTVSEGTLTYLNGVTFPATAKVLYFTSVTGANCPGSPTLANNPTISSSQAQNFLANTTVTINVVNNPSSASYTVKASVLFIGYVPW